MRTSEIILIIGPTASGKSDYAQNLALKVGGEIVNYDSQQFYRGLDIGTGKVPPDKRKVSHWLLDILDPGDFMSAGAFSRLACSTLEEIQRRGSRPILVGGTGLYVRALLEGLDSLPPRDPKIRQDLEERMREDGRASLHEKLREIDPTLSKKVAPQDASRLIRFLEIYEITGRKPSQLMMMGRAGSLRFGTETHWLKPKRENLRTLIAVRVRAMMHQGWVEEVGQLIDKGKHPSSWLNKPIGYLDLANALQEGRDPSQIEETITAKTVAYAKRQETFFKKLLSNPAYRTNGSFLKILEDFTGKS